MNNRLEIYFNTLAENMPEYLANLEKEALCDEVPIVRRATINLLRFLVRTKKPKTILEIGTAVGFSSLLMHEYMEENGKIITIEKVPARIDKAKKNFLEKFHIHT